jgi:hypothetical protein
LDGEIVALDKEGVPRFQLLQQWQKRPTAPVVFYLFDLLWSDGRDITGTAVLQQRDRVEQLINPAVPTLPVFANPGTFGDDKAGRRTLLIIFAHEIIGHMPRIICSPVGEGRHHGPVG